jgi:glycosyltransferase involved in cell wall biosynthesis
VNIWLITIGEPLPLPGADAFLLRTGRLAQKLAGRGHRVTWWSSDFDHLTKRYVTAAAGELALRPNLDLVLLHGAPYGRNLSLTRLRNHWQLGRAFRVRALHRPRPDAVLCSFPTIELSLEATRYGARAGVPVILDVRDLWPDIFVTAAPVYARLLARLALAPYFGAARRALAGADGIVAISEGYLAWGLARAGRGRGPRDIVIPLGYAPREADPAGEAAARAELSARGVDPGRQVCWFVGTFGRTYDLGPVIRAARGLWADDRRDLQFVLSGVGERDAEWRREASDLPNVVFTGWLDRRQIQAMLGLASVGLAAYAAEAPQGLPNKLFEYLSAGLPVVSSLRGETEVLLRDADCGVTYDAREPDTLRRAVARLLDEPGARDRLARNALAIFGAQFSAERIDDELLRYLEDVARGGRDPYAVGDRSVY